jgi:glyoxylase-like metal-dependent hydrolase (beta-lactamase superfamily II)
MISLKRFIFNSFYENTYIVWEKETREALIIDPGCFDHSEEKTIEDFISSEKIKPKYLVNTHNHIDHIFGCRFIKEKYKIPFLIPEEDLPLLKNSEKQAELFGLEIETPPEPDLFITEDLNIKIGNISPVFIFTPGHTPGEYCIYFPDGSLCISGDVLFRGSIGRTDLWGGSFDVLMNSIRKKLLVLPDDTFIYPGHGESSTIGEEKRNNPFLEEIHGH